MAKKSGNGELKDRDGRGGKDERSRAEEKIGSGPKGGKTITQPLATSGGKGGELEQRGMTSEDTKKHWKGNVPKGAHDTHYRGKK